MLEMASKSRIQVSATTDRANSGTRIPRIFHTTREKALTIFSHHDGSCSRFPKPRDECLGNRGRTDDRPTGTDIRQYRGQTPEGDFLVSYITHDVPVPPLPVPGGLGGTDPVDGSAPGQGHQPGTRATPWTRRPARGRRPGTASRYRAPSAGRVGYRGRET